MDKEAPEFAKAGQEPPEAIAGTCAAGEVIFFMWGTVVTPVECDRCEKMSTCKYWVKE